jgi:hypothetical protein
MRSSTTPDAKGPGKCVGTLSNIPYESPVLDGQYLSSDYYAWLFELQQRTDASAALLGAPVVLINQNAAIPITNIPLPLLTTGLYIIRYYARITNPDGVSSSLTVKLGWTESAQPLTASSPAMTGDAVTTVTSANLMVQADGNTAITYSTLYASNTPNKMKYRLSITVEALQ